MYFVLNHSLLGVFLLLLSLWTGLQWWFYCSYKWIWCF